MTGADWLMIVAVLLAPLIAVQVQKYLELVRERRHRKLGIFHTLMATRAARTSLAHVEALNRIDLEFHGRKFRQHVFQSPAERAVCDAWKVYRDHLNTPCEQSELSTWARRGDEQFADLLHHMGKSLGYDFDKVELRKGIYFPKAHGDEQLYQFVAREWFTDVVKGKKAIPIRILGSEGAQDTPSEPREARPPGSDE